MLTEKVIALNYEDAFTNIETALCKLINGDKYQHCKILVRNIIAQVRNLKFEVNRRDEALQRAKELLAYQAKGYVFCDCSDNITLEEIDSINDKRILANNASYILKMIEEIESCNLSGKKIFINSFHKNEDLANKA